MANIFFLKLLWQLHFFFGLVIKSVLSITKQNQNHLDFVVYTAIIYKYSHVLLTFYVGVYYLDLDLHDVMSIMKQRKQFVCQILICK